MNREQVKEYIAETYGAEAEHPWPEFPMHAVFRHSNNRKWFALIMDVPKDKLGLQSDGSLDIMNVKCDPILIGSLRTEDGFFPAYHMSKTSWISIALDGSVKDEQIKMLLDMSFDLTAVKTKRKKQT